MYLGSLTEQSSELLKSVTLVLTDAIDDHELVRFAKILTSLDGPRELGIELQRVADVVPILRGIGFEQVASIKRQLAVLKKWRGCAALLRLRGLEGFSLRCFRACCTKQTEESCEKCEGERALLQKVERSVRGVIMLPKSRRCEVLRKR